MNALPLVPVSGDPLYADGIIGQGGLTDCAGTLLEQILSQSTTSALTQMFIWHIVT